MIVKVNATATTVAKKKGKKGKSTNAGAVMMADAADQSSNGMMYAVGTLILTQSRDLLPTTYPLDLLLLTDPLGLQPATHSLNPPISSA